MNPFPNLTNYIVPNPLGFQSQMFDMVNLGSFLTLVEQNCYLCLGRINSIRNEQIYLKGNLSVNSKSFKLEEYSEYLYSLNSFVLVGLLFGVESSSSKGCSN